MTDSAVIFGHHGERPTLAQIRDWPATVPVSKAAVALGISRSSAYEACRLGEFPARVIKVRRRVVVVTADLLRLLSAGDRGPDAAP